MSSWAIASSFRVPIPRAFRCTKSFLSFFTIGITVLAVEWSPSASFVIKGAGGGLWVWRTQKWVYMCLWWRAWRATRCFLPDQKILFLTWFIAISNLDFTYNYIAVARFNRDYLKIENFELQNLSSPTFFELSTWNLAVMFYGLTRKNCICQNFD